MRVGSGGVMLPHYSPFKVAETFSAALRALPRPHRPRHRPRRGHRPDDDLRAPARPPHGRRPTTSPSSSPSCSRTTTARFPADHPVRAARPHAARAAPQQPEVWLLGSSRAERDLGRRSSACPTRSPTSSTPRARRSRRSTASASTPSERLATPRVAVAVWAICADTDEEAERIAASGRMTFTLLRQGRLIPVPPPEKALRFLATQDERRRAAASSARPRPCARGSRRSRRATEPRR